MNTEKEIQFSEHITVRVTTPEGFLFKAHGEKIAKIREAIESAIAAGHLEHDLDGDQYLCAHVDLPDEFRALFERLYVTEGGWRYLSTRYIGQVRLFPPRID